MTSKSEEVTLESDVAGCGNKETYLDQIICESKKDNEDEGPEFDEDVNEEDDPDEEEDDLDDMDKEDAEFKKSLDTEFPLSGGETD